MLDSDLLEELAATAAELPEITRLSEADAQSFVDSYAARFVVKPEMRWWWQALREPGERMPRGETDGLSRLAALLKNEDAACLVVTDDELPPWPVFRGPVSALLDFLRASRWFEFFLADPECRWGAFDTHHDELVVCGSKVLATGPHS